MAITTGPDGAMWFTSSYDKIDRIDTMTGAVTQYGDGITPGAFPRGITIGPDGNLWFTEAGGDRVGRFQF